MEHSGLVDAYDTYDVLLNYWADTMQDDCYMISNDGWTYPEVKAIKIKEVKGKKDKKDNGSDNESKKTNTKEIPCMYDEIICDLLPVNIVLSEYFAKETAVIDSLVAQIDATQGEMDNLVEQNTDTFTFGDNDEEGEDKAISVKTADVKKAIKNAKVNDTMPEELAIWKKWLDLSNQKDKLGKTLKQKRSELTDAVVAKYASLTEDEIRTLVVERKWLDTVIGGCMALMQSVTHRIGTEVVSLVERYENTLPELTKEVSEFESEVNGYLVEMGFTL